MILTSRHSLVLCRQLRRQVYKFSTSYQIDFKKDYYKILKIKENSDISQIKRNFYKLAKELHPDKVKGQQSAFKQINQAYNILSSYQQRKQYDIGRYVQVNKDPKDKQSWQSNRQSNSQSNPNGRQSPQNQSPYYHYSPSQWQQFRSGYQYQRSPQSLYYQNLSNNLSQHQLYSNFKLRKQKGKIDQLTKEKYQLYQEKIKRKYMQDIQKIRDQQASLLKQKQIKRTLMWQSFFIGRVYYAIKNFIKKKNQSQQQHINHTNHPKHDQQTKN